MIKNREEAKAILHDLIVTLSKVEQLVKLLSLLENKVMEGWIGAVSVEEIEAAFEIQSCRVNEEAQCIDISRIANEDIDYYVSVDVSIRISDISRVSVEFEGSGSYEIHLHMKGNHNVHLYLSFNEDLVEDDGEDYDDGEDKDEDEYEDEDDPDVPDVEFVTILHVGGKDYEVLCRGGEDGFPEWDPIIFERQTNDKGELDLEEAGNALADVMAAWKFYISTRHRGINLTSSSCECTSQSPDNSEEDPE
ncbi:MAG: hypothetical protein FWE76_00620 [Symbiobacteriaceae bacterium]|nr:hypothetical protein [Symbiobacteriaceae bacterium]